MNKKLNSKMPNLEDYSLVTQHLIMTEHLNPNHVIFGGQLLAWLDVDVYLHISKLVKYKKLVTVSMANVIFRAPGHLGEHIQIHAKLKELRRSSVTAFGKAIAYDPQSEQVREIIDCEITYVAVDENGKPKGVFQPQLN